MTSSDKLPLSGVRVLDLTRILAGPACTQLLGDMGADIIKVEQPAQGDDTRKWGPPFVPTSNGGESDTAAYYLCVNRNKRSLAVDISKPQGQALMHKLVRECDILVENFKVGGLKKYGLDYASVQKINPQIIYCSITGFGQSGPYAGRPGYDYLAQGMGGLMSITGMPDSEPVKAGVALVDVASGLYATIAIEAALLHKMRSGEGQHIDISLLDTQVSMLANEGLNYLTSGRIPTRKGNQHPNIVPYRVLRCANGYFILAVGNDKQFQKFCDFAGLHDLAKDPRFITNAMRVSNRDALHEILEDVAVLKTIDEWVDSLTLRGVPAGPVNTIDRVFADPQVQHRNMKIRLPYPDSQRGEIDLIGNPIKFSKTPPRYDLAPPRIGEHSASILRSILGLSEEEIKALQEENIIADLNSDKNG